MKTPPEIWSRLAALARRAPAEIRDEAAPYGFATRVAALALGRPAESVAALFSRYALRALAVACVLALAGVSASWRPLMSAVASEAAALEDSAALLEEIDATELS
jgi:hypothetical protein